MLLILQTYPSKAKLLEAKVFEDALSSGYEDIQFSITTAITTYTNTATATSGNAAGTATQDTGPGIGFRQLGKNTKSVFKNI